MKLKLLYLILSTFISCYAFAQNQQNMNLPYAEIPSSPSSYTAGSVASRMIDGLGFRYYWATEGLKESDLSYKPSEEARTSRETLEHIHGLSTTIYNTCAKKVNGPREGLSEKSFETLRQETLENFHQASQLISKETDLSSYDMVFKRGEKESRFDFWYLINGPIEDAVWHVGQIVSFRRASGNPFNSQVSLLQGKLR